MAARARGAGRSRGSRRRTRGRPSRSAMASCCTQPGRGYSMAIGRAAWATTRPRRSTRMAFVFVVPWSMARMSPSRRSAHAHAPRTTASGRRITLPRRRDTTDASHPAQCGVTRMATQYVALFGDPVDGNPTSRMQNAAFEAAGLDWRYLDIRVASDGLAAAIQAARVLGFGGLNLTIPHKVAVLPLLDELAPSAEISGACNTVVRDAGRSPRRLQHRRPGLPLVAPGRRHRSRGPRGRDPRRRRSRAGRGRRAGARRRRADHHRRARRGSPRRARRAPALAHERDQPRRSPGTAGWPCRPATSSWTARPWAWATAPPPRRSSTSTSRAWPPTTVVCDLNPERRRHGLPATRP